MNTTQRFAPAPVEHPKSSAGAGDDDRDGGRVYVYYNDDIALAVNVALATGRPLLLSGPSGSGKSALARNVAQKLGWRYYEHVVTARTEARDLLYRYDSVLRLAEAQALSQAGKDIPPADAYVVPGALWWAMSRDTAMVRGNAALDPHYHLTDESGSDAQDAVVLIDEIDKADPDLPNGLLVPLGSFRFEVEQTGARISGDMKRPPLVIITNNRERELPATFIRRCVSLKLQSPNKEQLLKVARAVIPAIQWNETIGALLADRLLALSKDQDRTAAERWSTGEYLDAVRACHALGITDPRDAALQTLMDIVLVKSQQS